MMTLGPALLGASVTAALAYLFVAIAITVVQAVRFGGRRDDPSAQDETLMASRFAPPVSILVPLITSVKTARRTLEAALALDYPEIEVVAVANDLAPAELDQLRSEWRLTAREVFYRHVLETAGVRRIYRSARDSRLLLVDKESGSYADALNCGVNLARLSYVVAIDPDITFDRDALLSVMAPAVRDSHPIVGITAHLERRFPPGSSARVGLTTRVRWLASIRALMETRLTPPEERVGLGLHETIVVWHRDAVLQAGGFSTKSIDPYLDLLVRLQDQVTAGAKGRMVRVADVFGRVDPGTSFARRSFAEMRGLAIVHTVTSALESSGRQPKRTLFLKVAARVAAAWIATGTLIGVVAGWFRWSDLGTVIVLLSFSTAIVSTAALLVRGSAHDAPGEADLKRLLTASPLEFILRRI